MQSNKSKSISPVMQLLFEMKSYRINKQTNAFTTRLRQTKSYFAVCIIKM